MRENRLIIKNKVSYRLGNANTVLAMQVQSQLDSATFDSVDQDFWLKTGSGEQ